MSEHDPNLAIRLDHDVAEVGGSFRCSLRRSPADGETNDKTVGKVRAVRIVLRMRTEGRGNTDRRDFETHEIPVDEYGMATADLELAVPTDAPISYDGSLIRVLWEIEARTDLKLMGDQRSSVSVLVVPTGGLGAYDRAHPMPHG